MTYKEQLESPLWQKKRLKIFERDNYTCLLCDDKSTQLHVHHTEYFGSAWEAPDDALQTLCKHCHAIVEFLKKEKVESPAVRVVKFDRKEGDVMLLVAILRWLDTNTFSYVFMDYEPNKKTIDYQMAVTPTIIKELYKENCILKRKYDPECQESGQ